MRISDWSSDVCSSDLPLGRTVDVPGDLALTGSGSADVHRDEAYGAADRAVGAEAGAHAARAAGDAQLAGDRALDHDHQRSEEHTSELQSLMRISYAVFCLKKKNKRKINNKL